MAVDVVDDTPQGKMKGVAEHMVTVNGDQDLTSLWTNARDYVASTYGRLKLLKQWCSNNAVNLSYPSYEDLAEALDQAYEMGKIAKQPRKRPVFANGIVNVFNQTWKGSRHRRHIVMSSVMREAVYSVTDNASDSNKVLTAYNQLLSLVNLPPQPNLPLAETALVYVLHNNPANLVLDEGPWNVAIGMLATNIRNTLTTDSDTLWKQYQAGPENFLRAQAKGFQANLQQNIIDFWITYAKANPPQDADDVEDLLLTMYDNAAFDLLSKQQLPNKDLMPTLLACHTGFETAQMSKKLDDIQKVCDTFIKLGLTSKPTYKDVLW